MKSSIEKLPTPLKNHIIEFYEGNGPWFQLFTYISLSMTNRNKYEYPYAKLNGDNSVSFFLTTENQNSDSKEFIELISDKRVLQVLEHFRKTQQFHLLNPDKDLINIINHPKSDTVEISLNISPEHLDAILRNCNQYTGYFSNETSVLKLSKQFKSKPGSIRLFPVLPLDEQTSLIQAAGCQVVEMPAVQLLHLLPNQKLNALDEHFHWIPDKVSEILTDARDDFQKAIGLLLFEENVLPSPEFWASQLETDNLISTPKTLEKVIIRDMDEMDRDFYLIYGNIGAQELGFCKSLEVSTLAFLESLHKVMLSKDQPSRGLPILEEMIRIEKNNQSSKEVKQEHNSAKNRSSSNFFSPEKKKDEALTKAPGFGDLEHHTMLNLCPIVPKDALMSSIEVGLYAITITSMQLLPLLVDYKPEAKDYETSYYWVPEAIEETLHIGYPEIESTIARLLFKHRLIDSESSYDFNLQSFNPMLIKNPEDKPGVIKRTAINEKTGEMYLRYGNISAEQLRSSYSLEVPLLEFLNALKEIVMEKRADKENSHSIDRYDQAISQIQKMISVEQQKITLESNQAQQLNQTRKL
jgi:hypothetical protein